MKNSEVVRRVEELVAHRDLDSVEVLATVESLVHTFTQDSPLGEIHCENRTTILTPGEALIEDQAERKW